MTLHSADCCLASVRSDSKSAAASSCVSASCGRTIVISASPTAIRPLPPRESGTEGSGGGGGEPGAEQDACLGDVHGERATGREAQTKWRVEDRVVERGGVGAK